METNWNAERSLGDWLKEEKIPGIYGIDTRALTKKLREHGVMMGRIVIGDADNEIENGELKIESERKPSHSFSTLHFQVLLPCIMLCSHGKILY